MRQLRCIATYSRRLGAAKNFAVLNRSTRQHDTVMSVSINNYSLDYRRWHGLHRLKTLTNCHQHSHVSSAHARPHALWCAVKLDSIMSPFDLLLPLTIHLAARGLRQMRAQTLMLYIIVLDFRSFALFLNHSARNASGLEKRRTISRFFTPVKNKAELVEMFIRIIRAIHTF